MKKNINKSFRRRLTSRPAIPRNRTTSPILQQVMETYSIPLITTGTGVISRTVSAIQPSGLILAARLTGYQAIFDEARLDLVTVRLVPLYGSNTRGRVVMYVERDPAAAIVASVDLANDQREKVVGSLYTPLSLTWRSQEPTDRVFHPLNPGTSSLGSYFLKGDSLQDGSGVDIPNANTIMTAVVSVVMTLRGRP